MKTNFIIGFLVLLFNISKAQIPFNFDVLDQPLETNLNVMLGESEVAIGMWDPSVLFIGCNSKYFNNGGLAVYYSNDGGGTWAPHPLTNINFNLVAGADPALVIDRNRKFYLNYVLSASELKTYSPPYNFSNSYPALSSTSADKNHLELDDRPIASNTQLYAGWFNGIHDLFIKSTNADNQLPNWNNEIDLTSNLITPYTGNYNLGINIGVGPQGNAYAAWCITDGGTASVVHEKLIGFASSNDKFINQVSVQYIPNLEIRGLKNSLNTPVVQSNRIVSWVTMAKNQQNGNIYLTWPNFGTPCDDNQLQGCNDVLANTDIFFIKSTDNGITWTVPQKVYTQNDPSYGQDHWNSRIACDPYTGYLGVIYYGLNAGNQVNTFLSLSVDGGITWTEQQINDSYFNSLPANKALTDYISLKMNNGLVVPVWSGIDPLNSNHQTAFTQPFNMEIPNDIILCNPVTPYYEIVKAQNSITLSQTNCSYETVSGSYLNYYAGSNIKFEPGFHASHGSKIHTHIETTPSPFNAHLRNINEGHNFNEKTKTDLSLSTFPNPFNTYIQINVTSNNDTELTMELYDSFGNLLHILLKSVQFKKGSSNFILDAAKYNIPKGVYFCLARSSFTSCYSKIIRVE